MLPSPTRTSVGGCSFGAVNQSVSPAATPTAPTIMPTVATLPASCASLPALTPSGVVHVVPLQDLSASLLCDIAIAPKTLPTASPATPTPPATIAATRCPPRPDDLELSVASASFGTATRAVAPSPVTAITVCQGL